MDTITRTSGWAISLAAISGLLVLAWIRAARSGAPGPGLARQGAAVLAALGFGACGFVGWAGLQAGASGGGGDGPFPEARSRYVYDLDARVPTQAIPRCEGAPRIVGTIPGGARPARAVDGALWFDAPDTEGLRQIRRRDPATREVDCFTCDQPGNNFRPTPSAVSQQVVFESDRDTTALRPLDRELYLLSASGPPPAIRLQRVTRDPGADLYGGVGMFGLSMAESGARVDIVEANAESIEAGRRAARDGHVEGALFTRGHVGPFLKKGVAAGRRAKVVVANPPRSGMGKSVPESIAAWHATRVVVISCDPATLARDAARLETAGYVLESVIPLDLFPQTAHVECVATFVRR